jgi:uncharacterized protein (DUF1697 family)
MALIVFLRGVNVGGHRRFRPSILAKQLKDYDVVNIGAAGTLIVRRPGPRTIFRKALLRLLPFETEVVLCDSLDLLHLESESPFTANPSSPDITRFVSIRSKTRTLPTVVPFNLPSDGDWFVRVIAARGQFIFGEYRRHMKTIGYLGQLDKHCGATLTTRNWNTILTVLRVLKTSPSTRARASSSTAL